MPQENGPFEVGDAVIHPVRGVGVVTEIRELGTDGEIQRYYNIKLLNQPRTNLMIPITKAEERGLRPTVKEARLDQIWHVFEAPPEILPDDYRVRHRMMREKVRSGDVLEVAEAVRDMAWRKQQDDGGLTRRGRRAYRKGLAMLAGELAAARGMEMVEARARILDRLQEGLAEHDSS